MFKQAIFSVSKLSLWKKTESASDSVLRYACLIFFSAIVIVYSSREVADLDIWLHLKTGQYIVQHHLIPQQDIFSFTFFGKPWINHEWLFQVVVYLFYAASGFAGLISMQEIVMLLTFLVLFLAERRRNNSAMVFGVLYLALLGCVYRIMIRPDIFSLLFISAYLCLLKSFVEKQSPLIWCLPVFQVLWVNMHGFSFTGPLLVFIFILSELTKRFIPLPAALNQTERIHNKCLKQLIIILGLLILASLVNPYGFKGALYPFSVIGQIAGKGKIIFQYIMELSAPFSSKNILDLNYLVFYKLLIILSFLSFVLNWKRINIADLFLWLIFLFFSFAARRNIAYFALVAGFVILNNTGLAREYIGGFFAEFRHRVFFRILRYFLVITLLYYSATSAVRFINEVAASSLGTYELRWSRDGLAQARYPQKAVDFLLQHNFPGRMFNDFNAGSYLIGNAFPQRKVFVDGRTEFYGPDFFMDYIDIGNGQEAAIEKIVKQYELQGFFLTISANDLQDNLLHYLLYHSAWKVVYLDERAVIFLQDTPENSRLISKFQLDLRNWDPPKSQSIFPYLYRMRFFNRHGFYEAAEKEAKNILALQPDNQESRSILRDIYLQQGFSHADKNRFDEAISGYTKAIEIMPTDQAYFYLGNAWKDKGDLAEAIAAYSKALALNPLYLGARHNRAVAYFLTNQYDKSWEDVYGLRKSGSDINSEILKQLQAASGRKE